MPLQGSVIALGYIAYAPGQPPKLLAEEPDQPTLIGSDVVEKDWSDYNKRYSIENTYRIINQGQKVGDDCKFTVDGIRESGEAPTVVRTVAFKPSTCEELLEVGDMSAQAQEARQKEREERDNGSSEKPLSANPHSQDNQRELGVIINPSSPLFGGLPLTEALLVVRFVDPIDLEVNYVETWLEWEYDNPNNKVYLLNKPG
jgi:hypothetical protein